MGNLDDPRLNYNYRTREHGTVPMDEERARFQWVSEVAYKNVHRIVSRGYDTTELVEKDYGLTDVLFIDFQSRIPLVEEEKMLNYVMVVMLEDGLSSPANISRIVASGKTLMTQAAGSSILAFGHAYGAYQTFGKLLDGILARQAKEGKPLAEVVEAVVREQLNDPALGVSGLMLKDPAAKRMIARAEKLGVAGKYIPLMKEVVKAAQKFSEDPVDIDLLGATGAAMFDLGFTPEATWGILAVTRAFAAGAHYCEEVECEEPVRLGQTLTPKEWYEGPEDRPVPTLEERKKVAKAMEAQTPEEWKQIFLERQKIKGSGWAIVEEIDDPKRKI
ncbi:MAG: hypothetical protein KJ814_08080 [Proteobacteria bacterium]|nr:hypothetical protein [Pseudomonadota bacterium]MBU2234640.1 hypothetical protein [Pseudomonadota bacterium]